jgi:hypothetical protein
MTVLVEALWGARQWICARFGHGAPARDSAGGTWCSNCGARL